MLFSLFIGCWWFLYAWHSPGICCHLPEGLYCGLPTPPAAPNASTMQKIYYLCGAIFLQFISQFITTIRSFFPSINNFDLSLVYLALYFIFLFYFSSRSLCMTSALSVTSRLAFYINNETFQFKYSFDHNFFIKKTYLNKFLIYIFSDVWYQTKCNYTIHW